MPMINVLYVCRHMCSHMYSNLEPEGTRIVALPKPGLAEFELPFPLYSNQFSLPFTWLVVSYDPGAFIYRRQALRFCVV